MNGLFVALMAMTRSRRLTSGSSRPRLAMLAGLLLAYGLYALLLHCGPLLLLRRYSPAWSCPIMTSPLTGRLSGPA